MPFINGRYHVNPAMGQALEAAREAEAALLALQRQARKNSGAASNSEPKEDSADPDDPSHTDSADDADTGAGPIHHVEIEATELVPSNSGRATRGFVARVHRSAPSVVIQRSAATRNLSSDAAEGILRPPRRTRDDSAQMDRPAPPPETHIFSDHGDLVNFLRDALAKDSTQR
jgi:hypothetical protein